MNKQELLLVKKINEKAIVPTKGSSLAAGYDIYSIESVIVPARGKQMISTGLQFKIPQNNYGRIAPRSGLACKKSIDVGGGVIDEDYRGEVKVILFNHSDEDFKINYGDRIAQMIIEKITQTQIVQVKDLDETQRGEDGFGSTGVN